MDYTLTTTSVTISQQQTNYNVTLMMIIDDEISESESEDVVLKFEKYNSDLDIEFVPASLTQVIKDDDGMYGCMNSECISNL